QRVVATVALGRGGDLADERDGPAGRHEVEQRVRTQRLRFEGAVDLAPDRVRGRGREAGGQRGGERVRVDAPRRVHGGKRAAGGVSRLTRIRHDVATIAREGDGVALGRRGVEVEMRDGEPDARLRRIRGRGGGRDQRDAGAVGQGESDRDDALRAHLRGRDLRHQTGAGQARRDGRERRGGTRRCRGRRRSAGDGGGYTGQLVRVRVALTARLGRRLQDDLSGRHEAMVVGPYHRDGDQGRRRAHGGAGRQGNGGDRCLQGCNFDRRLLLKLQREPTHRARLTGPRRLVQAEAHLEHAHTITLLVDVAGVAVRTRDTLGRLA